MKISNITWCDAQREIWNYWRTMMTKVLYMKEGHFYWKVFFLQETHQTESDIHFKDYQPDVICYQYSHLVCGGCIKLIEVKSNKKIKLEDGICQKLSMKE